MSTTFAPEALTWLSQFTGFAPQPFDIVQMQGSTSSSIFLIQNSRQSMPQRFVLRVLDNQLWLAQEPDLAAHEAAALEEAQQTGLRAPKLIAYATHDVGFGAPVVLMSFLEGTIELRPANMERWLHGMADQIATLHQHTAHTFPWRYQSWIVKDTLAVPAWSSRPHLWQRAIDMALGTPPSYRPVFIHRDYHATNVLWHQGAVSGIVDWINACQGPAGVDVGNCRLNLALMNGPEVADQFLDAYLAAADDFDYDPFWDLDTILDSSIPEPSFYEPWQSFGLAIIPPDVLKQRLDAYLERVMLRL